MANTTPTYSAQSAGNVRSSASLAAGASANYNVDFSGAFRGWLHIENTPGGTVAATRGLRIEIFRRYGSSPTTGSTAMVTYTLPSATASTAESADIQLETGYYNIKITNLDGTNAVTVEITSDAVSALATS